MWLPEDRDAALVWQEEQALVCSSCGTADWEWDDNPDAWYADTWRCEGCRRVAVKRREVENQPGSTDGLQLRLFRTPRQ